MTWIGQVLLWLAGIGWLVVAVWGACERTKPLSQKLAWLLALYLVYLTIGFYGQRKQEIAKVTAVVEEQVVLMRANQEANLAAWTQTLNALIAKEQATWAANRQAVLHYYVPGYVKGTLAPWRQEIQTAVKQELKRGGR